MNEFMIIIIMKNRKNDEEMLMNECLNEEYHILKKEMEEDKEKGIKQRNYNMNQIY